MPTPTKGARLGGSPSHQRLILANLATALFEHGRITTTEAKARRLRPYAEHLITKAKTDTVANRRHVVKVIRDKEVLHRLFTEIGPDMATRPGGYTRITKIGPRKGDNAPMAVIEIVETKTFSAQGPAPTASTSTAADEPEVNAADDAAEVETDVVPGAPAAESETEPATESDVEAAAEAVEQADPAPADETGDEADTADKA